MPLSVRVIQPILKGSFFRACTTPINEVSISCLYIYLCAKFRVIKEVE
jgi:hypothetical protein